MLSGLFNLDFRPPAGPCARLAANPSLSQKNQAIKIFTVKVAGNRRIFIIFVPMEKQANIQPFDQRVDEFVELAKFVLKNTREGRMPATKEFSDKFCRLTRILSEISEERSDAYMEVYNHFRSRLEAEPESEEVKKWVSAAEANVQMGILLTAASALLTACYNSYGRGLLDAAKASEKATVMRAKIASKGKPS